MKKKSKFLLLFVELALCICAISFGVYSLLSLNMKASGQIVFQSKDCNIAIVSAKVKNAMNASGTILDGGSQDINTTTNLSALSSGAWNFGAICFDDVHFENVPPIELEIIYNNNSDFPVSVEVNLNNTDLMKYIDFVYNFTSIVEQKTTNNRLLITISLKDENVVIASGAAQNLSFGIKFDKTNIKYVTSNVGYSYTTTGGVTTAIFNSYTGTDTEIFIPPTQTVGSNVYNVTSIGSNAFINNTKIKRVFLSKNIIAIGNDAFNGCTNLEEVNIPNGVKIIESNTFKACNNLKKISLPIGILTISDFAFQGCISLANMEIPNTVSTIGISSFSGCTGLTKLNFPDSVINIGKSALSGCTSLTELTIPFVGGSKTSNQYFGYVFGVNTPSGMEANTMVPKSLKKVIITGGTSFNDYAFGYCNGIEEILLPLGLTSISTRAFTACNALKKINLPNSLQSIGAYAFYFCYSLTEMNIPDNVTIIDVSAFESCSSILSLNLGNGLVTLNNNAFRNCTSLKSVSILNSVTSINDGAFSECSSLVQVKLSNKLTAIKTDVFKNCSSLLSIEIPSSVTSIAQGAFSGCNSLTEMTLPFVGGSSSANKYFCYIFGGNSIMSESEAAKVPASLKNINILSGTIEIYSFGYCKQIEKVVLPSGLLSIGQAAFRDCLSLKSVLIPTGLKTVNSDVFAGCVSLEILSLPDSISTIGMSAFYDCSSLINIKLPGSLTSLGENAFYNCKLISSINIPSGIATLGTSTFNGCKNLSIFDVDNLNTTFSSDNEGVLFNKTKTTLVRYPEGKMNTSYSIPNMVTTIGNNAFTGCTNLTDVVITSGIASFGTYVFNNCTNLARVYFERTTTFSSIGNGCFNNLKSGSVLYFKNSTVSNQFVAGTHYTSANTTKSTY